ncbi:MAG TPA: type II toxin-antitoxin system HicB family antitoxin [Candidatus Woesebacteria bacterium]|nr:type II toxin-antitoxin system HicB family antitoxin [Candidatus Woesebacteria bacterium]
MKTSILKYNVVLRKEDKYYISDVPALGISDFGKTIEEAKKNTEKAIEIHIEGLVKTNTEVPPSDTIGDVYFSQASVKAPKDIRFIY